VVAGPENSVRAALDTELGLESRLDVDIAQDTESLLLQRLGDARDGFVERGAM
jgi:hypothetical protein